MNTHTSFFPEWTALDNVPTSHSVPYLPCHLRIARVERKVSACACGRLARVVGGVMNDMLDLVEMRMMKEEGLLGKACIERSYNRV